MTGGEREDRSQGPFAAPWRATSLGVGLLVTLFAFETVAVATAMPSAVRELDGLAYYGWPFSAFLLTSLVGLVVAGGWGDRVGPRGPLLTGIAVFAAGLVVAGTAPWMWTFVLGRGMQGLGVGMASVAAYLIIGAGYPPWLRPRAMSIVSAAYVLPALVGPVISGALATYLTWRLVFLGLVPLLATGAVLLLPVLRRIPRPTEPPARPRRRVPYAILTGAAVLALQYAGARVVTGVDAVGVLAGLGGIAGVLVGLRVLLPAGTLRLRAGVPAVIGLRGLVSGAFFSVESVLPLTLTTLHGMSPITAGLPLLVGAVGWAGGAQVQGRVRAVPRHVLVRCGFVALAVCVGGLVLICLPGMPGWPAYPLWIFGGLGMGLVMPTTGVLMLDLSPEQGRGANSSALQISDVTGSSLCIGLAGAVVGAAEHGLLGLAPAVGSVTALMAVIAVAGAFLAGRVRRSRLA
ncbi:MFS transporter [Pseudonocardia acaciae]|uniref:MFS transporter n=1 Tax=Pseudonocardia acaciae TaxID=551276 RepID=UPI000683F285|nr:MFS transporter [Pseudonocardia acaciae]